MTIDQRQVVLALANAAEASFSSSDWTEVAYLTATEQYVDGHPRLIRSLQWGDSDYKGHVIDVIAAILKLDKSNLGKMLAYPKIQGWLNENQPGIIAALHAIAHGTAVPEVIPTGFDAAITALSDAQALLTTRGPTSAVDRVHTGLHGFLREACKQAGLKIEPEATANQLLKVLLEAHPGLQTFGPRTEDVRKIVRASAAIVDSMGTLRNRATLAHPNEELLGHTEALLVINLSRSLIAFLDSKFKETTA